MQIFSNEEIAHRLRLIALYLEMDDDFFRARAYEKVSNTIESLTEQLMDIYRKGGRDALMDIPGIGEGIASKIEELFLTGKINSYEELKKKVPVNIEELSSIEGLGPKKIKALYKKLKIKNAAELEAAAKAGKIRRLAGFGEKSEEKILKSISFMAASSGRFVLGHVLPYIMAIEKQLSALPQTDKCIIAGSVRRRKETIGDADMLVVSTHAKEIMDYFVKMPDVMSIIAKGDTKSSVKMKNGLNVDLRVVSARSFGAALNYFTGSKDHNVSLRSIAKAKGLKLSEYGLFRNSKYAAVATEQDVYKALGLRYVEPELRENTGELQASAKNELPDLIAYNDLKGDLQVQTNWTDGQNSIKEMAVAAKSAGLEYICITDHTKSLAMTGGLDEAGLARQAKEIERAQKEVGIRIFHGAEVNITKTGELDIKNDALKKLDIVGIAIHSFFMMKEKEMTARIKKAMENPNADILFHPTGRIIQKREPYAVDIAEIIDQAKALNKILEIDAYPDRTDLKDEHIRMAVQKGAKLCIDSDAHNTMHYRFLEFGIAAARRGWAAKSDIVNTLPLRKFEKFVENLK